MTTFPKAADPVSAMTRADGTTEAHHTEHGRMIGVHENVKAWGAKGDGVSDDAAAIQACMDSGAKTIVFPAATYFLAEGSSITLPYTDTRIIGLGTYANNVVISSKNAYGFKTPLDGTASSNNHIEGFNFVLRSGSTSGGGIRVLSSNYHSGWSISDICVNGQTTSTDPGIWVSGFVGSYLDHFRVASCGGDGVLIGGGTVGGTLYGFASNQWMVTRGSVNANALSATSYAGLHIGADGGAAKGEISMTDFESNRGYGILAESGDSTHIHDCWFEDNWFTSIKLVSVHACNIESNRFEEPHNPETANTRHVHLTETVPTRGNFHRIAYNNFFGPNNGGYPIEIGTDVTQTRIEGNRGAPDVLSTLVDAGYYTTYDHATAVKAPTLCLPIGTGLEGGVSFRAHGAAPADAPAISSGSGSPEGSVTRPVGSLYLRTGGAAATTVYFKATGTGTTGWKPVASTGTSAYSTTNVSTDRSYDANATTTDELADVLGTLIADLKTLGVIT